MSLSEPLEILELRDGLSLRLKVSGFQEGRTVIHPRYQGAPESKEIPVLRLLVPSGVKPTGAPYYDVTSKTLQAQLRPLLPDLVKTGREVVITAHGSGPSKRFSVRLE